MKLFKTSILAVLVLCGAVLAVGCGSGADEAVTKYLEAQKARDVDAQVKLMREKDQAEAKESVKAAMRRPTRAGRSMAKRRDAPRVELFARLLAKRVEQLDSRCGLGGGP